MIVESVTDMTADPTTDRSRTSSPIVDCDVHVYPRDIEEIKVHMAQPWRDIYHGEGRPFYMFAPMFHGQRLDAVPPGGGDPATDPQFLSEHHLEKFGISRAVLLPRVFCNMHPNPDYASAMASAFNDWLAETWLGKYNSDGVFKGSINIAQQDPQGAVREIERWAGHPHFVQVMIDAGSRAPLGHREYWPIYEACARNGFPFAIHPGTDGMGINHQPTPGYPTHYIEWHTCLSLSFQAHLVSFITGGVFEKYSDFKVVLVEGGVAWVAPRIWRLDHHYKAMRAEVPWMKRRPHEYLKDHVRMTSQPLERPDDPKHILQILEMLEAENFLMFASDYPHWDFDSPRNAFPKLSQAMHDRIFYQNADALYGLGLRSENHGGHGEESRK